MPDYLSCGYCPLDFELADIMSFIEHKKRDCTDHPNSTDPEMLECSNCSQKFNTPLPLLIHVQKDHKIIVVRNFQQLQTELAEEAAMEVDEDEKHTTSKVTGQQPEGEYVSGLRDVFCQTDTSLSPQSVKLCCQEAAVVVCCQKQEPQCYDESCKWPTACTMTPCESSVELDDHELEQDPKTKEEMALPRDCCPCPSLIRVKRESKNTQTDLDPEDGPDINFLLSSNNSDCASHRDFSPFPPPGQPYILPPSPYLTNGFNNANGGTNGTWNYYPQQQMTDQPPSMPSTPNFIPNFEIPTSPPYPNQPQMLQSSNRQFFINPNSSRSPTPNPVAVTTDTSPAFIGYDPRDIVTMSRPLFPSLDPNQPVPQQQQPQPPRFSMHPLPPDNGSGDADNISAITTGSSPSRRDMKFACPTCPKRFRQKVHLRKHIMSQHANQKPHQCSQCAYTTVEKSHLTVHIRTHTGERPYTCRRCSYSSAQNCTLKSHYLRRHPGDQISCGMCGIGFITEQERNNHQRSCRIVNGNSGQPQQLQQRPSSKPPSIDTGQAEPTVQAPNQQKQKQQSPSQQDNNSSDNVNKTQQIS